MHALKGISKLVITPLFPLLSSSGNGHPDDLNTRHPLPIRCLNLCGIAYNYDEKSFDTIPFQPLFELSFPKLGRISARYALFPYSSPTCPNRYALHFNTKIVGGQSRPMKQAMDASRKESVDLARAVSALTVTDANATADESIII